MQIWREIGGSTQIGVDLVQFFGTVCSETRAMDYKEPYRFSGKRAWRLHWHLARIAPDDRLPQFGDGSAHDLMNRYWLDAERGEQCFVHAFIDHGCSVLITTHIDRIGALLG